MKQPILLTAALLGLLLIAACASKEEADADPAPAAPASAAAPTPPKNEGIAAASQSLEAGKFDEAAARLLEVRTSGKELSAKEAADYREALEAAYSQALEASQKGDPRAQATLQMIKAATAR